MFLNDVHDLLCSGELSQSYDGDSEQLKPEAIPKINTLIQAGINDLNNKFAIRENELLLRPNPLVLVYELIPANAVSSGNPDAFIIDSLQAPYVGDISQVTRVVNSNGKSLWLNTDTPWAGESAGGVYGAVPPTFNFTGINFDSYNTLRLQPHHNLGDVIVRYKAKAKKMDTSLSPDNTYIDLPDHYLNALAWYVIARKHNPKGAETIGRGMFHEGDNYWAKYMAEVGELRNSFAGIASMGETTNFERGGWV